MIETNQGFSSMGLSLHAGVTEDGKSVFKEKTYSRVKPSVTDADFYAVGEALAGLSAWTLHHIDRTDRAAMFSTATL